MVEKAVPVRTISYEQIDGQKIRRDVMLCYDFEVPYFWQPQNNGYAHTFLLSDWLNFIHTLIDFPGISVLEWLIV